MSRHPSIVPSQLFETADGHVVVMPQTQDFWRALCVGLGIPELVEDDRFRDMESRRAHKEELVAILTEIFQRKTSDEWIQLLADVVPIGKVNSFAEAMDGYAVEYPSQIVTWEHESLGPVRTIGSPIRINGSRTRSRRAPYLGEHTDEVLSALGRDIRSPQVL